MNLAQRIAASRRKVAASASPDIVSDLVKEIATKKSKDIRVIATERLKLYRFVRINNEYNRAMLPVRLRKFRARVRHKPGQTTITEVGPDLGRGKMYWLLSNGQILRADRVLRPDRPGSARDVRRNRHFRLLVVGKVTELAKTAEPTV